MEFIGLVFANLCSVTDPGQKKSHGQKWGRGLLWVISSSAPQKVQSPEANNGLGDDGDFDGDEMSHEQSVW